MIGNIIIILSFLVPLLKVKNKLFWLLPIFTIETKGWGFMDMGIYGKFPISSFSYFLLLVSFFFLKRKKLSIQIKNFILTNRSIQIYFLFSLFLLFQFFVSYIKYDDKFNVLSGAVPYSYYLSFFLFMLICFEYQQEKVNEFVRFILYLSIFQGIIYCFHALGGINIFPASNIYAKYDLGTNTVQRIYHSYPEFLSIAFYYIFYCQKKISLIVGGIFAGCLLAILTRHLLIFSFLQFLVALTLSDKKFLWKLQKWSISIVGIGIVSLILYLFFDYYFYAFFDRFNNFQRSGMEESNLALRLHYIKLSWQYITTHDPIFGVGFIREAKFLVNSIGFGSFVGDSTIANLNLQLGILGIVFLSLFLIFFFNYLITNYHRDYSNKRWINIYLCSYFLLLPIWAIFTTNFQNPGPIIGFFWAYAIVLNYRENEKVSNYSRREWQDPQCSPFYKTPVQFNGSAIKGELR